MSNPLNILFLTYLTGYSIRDIHLAIKSDDLSGFMDKFLLEKKEKGNPVSQDQINDTWRMTKDRYEEMRFQGIEFIQIDSIHYPQSLRAIQSPPPMLYLKGKLKKGPHIAIVGTREISNFAKPTIQNVAKKFGEKRYGIVSGLAYGIDKLSHEVALELGLYTLAVLPNSLDHIYPKEHLRLANDILESGGGLISELPIGINLGKKAFVQRNRIQSGVSQMVLPIEMTINSGTMHTVQFSIQQKKTLLVIQPDEQQEKLSQYEGILHLTKSSYEKLVVLKKEFVLKDIPGEHMNTTPENNLYHIELLSDEEIKEKKAATLKLFKELVTEECRKAKDNLSITKEKVENYSPIQLEDWYLSQLKKLQANLQDLVFDFIAQHTIIQRKNLEKIAKAAINKSESAFHSTQ